MFAAKRYEPSGVVTLDYTGNNCDIVRALPTDIDCLVQPFVKDAELTIKTVAAALSITDTACALSCEYDSQILSLDDFYHNAKYNAYSVLREQTCKSDIELWV